MTITAAADGSALGNPGPAGWAWYVNDDCWRAGGWPHGTNNQGELMAVLDLFRATAHVPEEDLRVLCDSQYVINSITKWMPGWKRKGWRKADGKPVLNVELLKELDREIAGRKYTFEWVKGHAGHDLNEAADVRARAAATAYQQGVAARSGPGFAGAPEAVGSAVDSRVAVSSGAGTVVTGSDGQGSYGQDLFNQGPYDEPDLFSELESDSFIPSESAGAEMSPEAIVEALERELSGADIRGDIGRTGVLLHPDFMEIGTSGRLWTRDATMMALEEEPAQHTELEVLGADRIGTSAILLTCRSYSRLGTVLHSSLWVLDGTRWRLRFRQGTPEA
ncbi:RNase H family protein [Pseudarthrobacter cellobiosi]|uniref:RNase H family protein n=1 Tax=Pseudarthrobacter cellobiosi TaxID=2953654 RepID=UPI00208F50D1|nr:ribonuclease HI family protein [Pseudarthrobacter sp. HLT1-5]MCO4254978.1 ribonuclease HI family protein [Pseudarthrobacter sp. HLT1-5]